MLPEIISIFPNHWQRINIPTLAMIIKIYLDLLKAMLGDGSSSQLPFDAREVCGHTLKSSLIHKLSFDTRDDRVMPSSGAQAALVQELAGLSPIGTAACFKTTFSASISKR